MSSYDEGFDSFLKISSVANGVFVGEKFVHSINDAISNLEKNINQHKGFVTPDDKLKGNIAEFWHSGTFNINAAVNSSSDYTQVLQSNNFASVDIGSNFGNDYGLKYYKTATDSAKQQSKSFFERYCEDIAKNKESGKEFENFSDYLKKRNIDENLIFMNDPIYQGQVRIIPTEQLEEAKKFLEKKIITESQKRPELVAKYKETLNMLTDKIDNNKGIQSIELTNKEAEEIAKVAKNGDFKAEDYNLTTEELIGFQNIMSEALKAGTTAAVITTILKTAPELVKIITKYFKEEQISVEDFKKLGLKALNGSAESFIRGSLAAAITVNIKAGNLGKVIKNIDPSVIGCAVAVSMNLLQNSIQLSSGNITKQDFAYECTRDLFVTTGGIVTGAVFELIPGIQAFGFLLGNFIGSILSSFIYEKTYNKFMSLCIDTGFTCFGFVDQNYKLPNDVLQSLGIETFEYEKMQFETFEFEKFVPEIFNYEKMTYCSIDFRFIRRGVIGINKIAYY